MSKPLWLMMGTAFPIQTSAADAAAATVAPPQLLLTAKHTFAPWDYAKDASQLKIPEDYRKLRFVVGKMYRTDEDGRSMASEKVNLRLVSQHPNLDVAVLAVDAKKDPDTQGSGGGTARAGSASSAGSSTSTTVAPVANLFDSPLALCSTRYPAASEGRIIGYRGRGRLGELDTLDPSLLQRLPAEEREALLKNLQDIEGKQLQASTTVTILDEKGMCKGTGDMAACYHGMSGGPLLTASGCCAGILYGHHPDAPGCLGYTPCADFADWLAGVVQRVAQRKEKE